MATFEEVWTTIDRTDVDPAHHGVDWMAVKVEFMPRVANCTTREELRVELQHMLARLGRSHYGLLPAETANLLPDGDNNDSANPQRSSTQRGSTGMDVRVIEDQVVVVRLQPNGPAAQAGVQCGWVVEECSGQPPIHQPINAPSGQSMSRYVRDAAVQAMTLGPAGQEESWVFSDPAGTLHPMTLQRVPATGTSTQLGLLPTLRVHCEDRLLTPTELQACGVAPDRRLALIAFNIWMPAIALAIDEAVDRHRSCDGIILDLRGNPGGVGAMVIGVAGHFYNSQDSLGTLRTRDTTLDFKVNPRRSTPDGRVVEPISAPLVIVVDSMSASTTEIFAGGLQSLHRASIIGRTTAGAALPAQMKILPSGDGLLFAFADFTRPDGKQIEGIGIEPDVTSGTTVESWRGSVDPDVAAAAKRIEQTLGHSARP